MGNAIGDAMRGAAGSALGGAAWVVWVAGVRPGWTAALLLLSPFVLLTLGLRLVARVESGPQTATLGTLGSLAPVIATSAAASFVPDPGLFAAVLSLPWLAFTLCVALVGVGRMLSRRSLLDPTISTDAGLMFVAIGGAWLTISRAGLNPLGFSDDIVQLTAVHFHYAGFVLPIVVGLTAGRLRSSALVPVAVVVGVPLTAVGITVGGWLEWIGATAMAFAGLGAAALLVRLSTRERGLAGWLVGIAGIALVVAMSMALGWSWSAQFGWEFVGLGWMAATHGSLNAIGFGLLGLIGLNILAHTTKNEPATTSLHLGRPTTANLERLAAQASSRSTTNPHGLIDRPVPEGFRRSVWQHEVEHGDFAAACEAIRQWHGHRAAGIRLSPARPAINSGQTLALAIPVGPVSVTATCRIIDVIDEPDRYGFTYSTLPHHPADGEESFIVSRHDDAKVDITVTAVWRPATLASKACLPLARHLQHRAIGRYLDGIATLQPATTQEDHR